MNAPAQWDPLKELMTVQKRMNKLFESALGRTGFDTHDGVDTWSPVCDVYETPESLVMCLELPGFEMDQIEVRLESDDLVVSGERKISVERPGEHYHRVERSYGKFLRRFHLPSTADREAIEASYRDGLLRVTLPSRGGRRHDPIHVAIQ